MLSKEAGQYFEFGKLRSCVTLSFLKRTLNEWHVNFIFLFI